MGTDSFNTDSLLKFCILCTNLNEYIAANDTIMSSKCKLYHFKNIAIKLQDIKGNFMSNTAVNFIAVKSVYCQKRIEVNNRNEYLYRQKSYDVSEDIREQWISY